MDNQGVVYITGWNSVIFSKKATIMIVSATSNVGNNIENDIFKTKVSWYLQFEFDIHKMFTLKSG